MLLCYVVVASTDKHADGGTLHVAGFGLVYCMVMHHSNCCDCTSPFLRVPTCDRVKIAYLNTLITFVWYLFALAPSLAGRGGNFVRLGGLLGWGYGDLWEMSWN